MFGVGQMILISVCKDCEKASDASQMEYLVEVVIERYDRFTLAPANNAYLDNRPMRFDTYSVGLPAEEMELLDLVLVSQDCISKREVIRSAA